MDEEERTQKHYFRLLNAWKNDGRRGPKPTIGQAIREVGSRSHETNFRWLKKGLKTVDKTVVVETSIWALLKEARRDDGGKTNANAEAAIQRLQRPVLIVKNNAQADFPALLTSVRRKGGKLILKVDTHWFRHHGVRLTTPLPPSNQTALALYLFMGVAKDGHDDGIDYKSLCKRLHLDPKDKWLARKLNKAVDMLNQHLTEVGLPKVEMDHPRDGYIRFSRV
jgi:hypothetical protein